MASDYKNNQRQGAASQAYDVFVSFNSADRAIARQIHRQLTDDGLSVFIDEQV